MNIDLSDKTALVTGSTAGIGYAAALGLARMGAEVIVNGRTRANGWTARFAELKTRSRARASPALPRIWRKRGASRN